MKKYILFLIVIAVSLTSCNDDFLERLPKSAATVPTFFTSYENFKTYSWQFYAGYSGYSLNQEYFDTYTDNGFYTATRNPYANDMINELGSSDNGWYFTKIRTIHQLLDNIDNSSMSDVDKMHWRSVGYFFKAEEYFRLMSRFGDVIWVDKVLDDSDDEILYAAATPRLEIASKILEMLKYAQLNIKPDGDGRNTVNLNVVNALISRFGLFEGTWEKYQKLSNKADYDKYLQASYDASAALIAKYPNPHSNYNEVFNSLDLTGNNTVLLFKVFYVGKNGHQINRGMGSSASYYEATSDLVQAYLCTDGKPIWTSDQFKGDKVTGDAIMNDEFRNRDKRLYYSICPPYRSRFSVLIGTSNSSATLVPTGVPQDDEYRVLMNSLSTATAQKPLPMRQWNGEQVREIPHFPTARYNVGQGFNVAGGGYSPFKIYTPDNQGSGSGCDAPIYRMGEVMVNHAEAAWELGIFTQAVADISINKLRTRAGITNMTVSAIDANFDPKRDKGGWTPAASDQVQSPPDYAVDPVLWEIRRERRVELYCEGFRFNDLRRWAKGKYISTQIQGAYIKKMDYEDDFHLVTDRPSPVTPPASKANFTMKLVDDADKSKDAGRVYVLDPPSPGWLNKYYLYYMPITQLTLNPNLKQNPGYKGVQ